MAIVGIVVWLQGLEKYLLTKLYDRTFGVYRADVERDEIIERRLQVCHLQHYIQPAELLWKLHHSYIYN